MTIDMMKMVVLDVSKRMLLKDRIHGKTASVSDIWYKIPHAYRMSFLEKMNMHIHLMSCYGRNTEKWKTANVRMRAKMTTFIRGTHSRY